MFMCTEEGPTGGAQKAGSNRSLQGASMAEVGTVLGGGLGIPGRAALKHLRVFHIGVSFELMGRRRLMRTDPRQAVQIGVLRRRQASALAKGPNRPHKHQDPTDPPHNGSWTQNLSLSGLLGP